MKNATHLLITRFAYPPDHPDLHERIDLFRRFTLPSVKNQTCQDFSWLILTNQETMRHIPYTLGEYPRYVIKTIHGVEKSMHDICNTEWLISSRCDNDDVLAPNFIQNIQGAFEEKEFAIDFPGYRYNLQTGDFKEFNLYGKQKQSPFVSAIQRTETAGKGIMQWKHGEVHQHLPVKIIPKRSWCQLIHGGNKLMKWTDSNPAVYKDTKEKPWFL